MADYRKAFRAGLDAYEDAEQAHKEIFEVFDELPGACRTRAAAS